MTNKSLVKTMEDGTPMIISGVEKTINVEYVVEGKLVNIIIHHNGQRIIPSFLKAISSTAVEFEGFILND